MKSFPVYFALQIIILCSVISQAQYSQKSHYDQFLKKQSEGKEKLWIDANNQSNKINKGSKLSSLVYKPVLVVCDDSLRDLYTYDDFGNTLTYREQHFTKTGWVNIWRQSSTYDNSGYKTSLLFEEYQNNLFQKILTTPEILQ